ncbi:MAG: cysteine-rich CWC family protein [Chitinophagaceae bacterium]|nr:cysteine-rich CWC family protein [Polaromonas sp.]
MATAMTASPNTCCAQCGAGFECGAASGAATCWCFDLPPFLPVPNAPVFTSAAVATAPQQARCLCPACLQNLLDDHDAAHFSPAGC